MTTTKPPKAERLKIGTRVLVSTSQGHGRIDRIVDITKNKTGSICYWLANGGLFFENELEVLRSNLEE